MKKSVISPLIHLLLIISMIGLAGCLDSGRAGYPSVEQFGASDGEDTPTDDTTTEEDMRPSDAISVSNYCICQSGKPLVINNCAAECANRPTTDSKILYVSVDLGAEISGDSTLKDLHGWCNTAYGEGNNAPNCSVKVYDEFYSVQTLEIEEGSLNSGSNTFSVSLSTGNVQQDRRYKFQLVENQSGATSKMNGFKMEDIDTSDSEIRPLRLDIINLYSCVARAGSIVSGANNYERAVKMNFFFAASDRPEPMPPNERFTLCHDPYADGQGSQDKIQYPRLFETQGIFALWNRTDGLFTASSSTPDRLEVNVLIAEEVQKLGKTLEGDIFGAFRWPTAPSATTSSSDSSSSSVVSSDSNISSGDGTSIIGYYMQPWVNNNEVPYCPNRTHYDESGDPVFEVLGKFVGETEGIFMAKREAKTIIIDGVEQTAPMDVLLIRENILNQIWFYHDFSAQQHKRADYNIARQETIMFYWPPNFAAPLQPNTNSDMYWVRFPEDIGPDTSTVLDGSLPKKKPGDKRFGCIPMSSDI